MTLLRKSFSVINKKLCKSPMSLFMSLKDNVTLIKNINNLKLLMTITTNTANNGSEMTPSPPSSNLTDTLAISPSPVNTLETPTKPTYSLNNGNFTTDSELIKLGKEFNKFYFNGK